MMFAVLLAVAALRLVTSAARYEAVELPLSDAQAICAVSPLTFTLGDGKIYDLSGHPTSVSYETHGKDVLGVTDAGEIVLGTEHLEEADILDPKTGERTSYRYDGFRTFYEHGLYLETKGDHMIIVGGSDQFGRQLGEVSHMFHWDLYCVARDGRSVFLTSDALATKISKVTNLTGSGKARRSRPKLLHTSSGKPLKIMMPFSASLVEVQPRKLIAFCLFEGFTAQQLVEAPSVTVGPNKTNTGLGLGLCSIDPDTGLGTLILKIIDGTIDTNDTTIRDIFIDPGHDRRRDLAALGADGSFLAIYENRVILVRPKK